MPHLVGLPPTVEALVPRPRDPVDGDSRPTAPAPVLLPILVAVLLWAGVALSPAVGVPHRHTAAAALSAIALIVGLTRCGEAVRLPGGRVVAVVPAVLGIALLAGLALGARWSGALDGVVGLPYGALWWSPPGMLLAGFTTAVGAALGWLLTAPAVAEHELPRRRLLTLCSEDDAAVLRRLPDFSRFELVGSLTPAGGAAGGALLACCAATRAHVIVVGSDHVADPDVFAQLRMLQSRGVRVRLVSDFVEEFCQRVPLDRIDPRWFLFDVSQLHARHYRAATSVLDVVAGLLALAVLAVVGPFIALAVKATSAGPVLYRQQRVGQAGRTFSIVKFRTMTADAEAAGVQQASVQDARITSVGAFLRRSRLDELPQAWNLLRRDMALIGPRPERPEFVAQYAEVVPWYTQRQLVRPGLTGWAQVTEGYTSDVAGTVRKLERDLYYLKHQSPRLDLAILAATAQSFLRLGGR